MKKSLLSVTMVLVLLLTFTFSLTVSAASATAIKFEKTSDMNAEVGKAYRRTAITTPEGIEVTYTSSNPKVATVGKEGRVKAIAGGTAVITATSGKVKASYNVNVKKSDNATSPPKTTTAAITPELQAKINTVKKMYPKAHFSQVGDNKDGTRGEQCVVPFFLMRVRQPYEFFSHEIEKFLSGEYAFTEKGEVYNPNNAFFRNTVYPCYVYDTYTYDWVKKHQTEYFYMNKEGTSIYIIHPPKEALSWLNTIHNYDGNVRGMRIDQEYMTREFVNKYEDPQILRAYKFSVDTHYDEHSPSGAINWWGNKTTYDCWCGKKLETPKRPW